MSRERLCRLERIIQLERIIAAMPAYPIYCEREGGYSIYIQSRRHIYPNETAARISQLGARTAWLRTQDHLATNGNCR